MWGMGVKSPAHERRVPMNQQMGKNRISSHKAFSIFSNIHLKRIQIVRLDNATFGVHLFSFG